MTNQFVIRKGLQVQAGGTELSGSLSVSSSVYSPAFSGSFYGTSSQSITSSYSFTASYAINGGTRLSTGSSYPITSSWSNNSISSSYAPTQNINLNAYLSSSQFTSWVSSSTNLFSGTASYANKALSASYAPQIQFGLETGSTYPITSSWAINARSASYWNSSSIATILNNKQNKIATGSLLPVTSSWSVTASYVTESAIAFTNKTNYYSPVWINNKLSATSSVYDTGKNVGINTTSPTEILEVHGDVKISSGSAGRDGLFFQVNQDTGNGSNQRIFFSEANTSDTYGFSFIQNGGGSPIFGGISFANLPTQNYFHIVRHNADETGSIALSIDRTTGYVGIGETLPTTYLDVNGLGGTNADAKITGRIYLGTISNGGIWMGGLSNQTQFHGSLNAGHTGMYVTGVGWGFLLQTGSGNVGIGSTNPSYRLTVNNNLYSTTEFASSSLALLYNSNPFLGIRIGNSWETIYDNPSTSANTVKHIFQIRSNSVFSISQSLITSYANIVPSVTNTYDLGSTSLYWNNLYAKNITGSLLGTSSWAANATPTFTGKTNNYFPQWTNNVLSETSSISTNSTSVIVGDGKALAVGPYFDIRRSTDAYVIEHTGTTGSLYLRGYVSGDTSGDVYINDLGGAVYAANNRINLHPDGIISTTGSGYGRGSLYVQDVGGAGIVVQAGNVSSGYSGWVGWYSASAGNASYRQAYMGFSTGYLLLHLENNNDYVINGGSVGFGTTTPRGQIDVFGEAYATNVIVDTNLKVTGSSYFANNVILRNTGLTYSPPIYFSDQNGTGARIILGDGGSGTGNLYIHRYNRGVSAGYWATFYSSSGDMQFGGNVGINTTPSDDIGLYTVMSETASYNNTPYGSYNLLKLDSTGSRIAGATAVFAKAQAINNYNSTHASNALAGIFGQAENNGTGSINAVAGVKGLVTLSGEGNITSSYAGYFDLQNTSFAGVASTGYGVYITDPYGTFGNVYGIYQNGTTAKNYFGGNIGIGTSNPDTNLYIFGAGGTYQQLKVGSSTSPFKYITMGVGTSDAVIQTDTTNNANLYIQYASTGNVYLTNGGGYTVVGSLSNIPSGYKLVVSGSQTVTKNLSVTGSIYGTLVGTASYALNGSGGISGGTKKYFPVWSSGTSLSATSSIVESAGNIGIGTTSPSNPLSIYKSTYYNNPVGIGVSIPSSGIAVSESINLFCVTASSKSNTSTYMPIKINGQQYYLPIYS